MKTLSFILTLFLSLVLFPGCLKKEIKTNTETSKNKAINFLIQNQEADGSWLVTKHGGSFQGKDGIISVTSIALVSLLNVKKTRDSKKVKQAINKGLTYLWKNQKTKGNIGKNNYANGLSFYATTLAITTNNASITRQHKILFENILSKQSNVGAWDYAIANNHRNDLSISAWIALGLSESIKINKYNKQAIKAISKLIHMLDQDQKGAGDNSIATKAGSAYTYGSKPNLKIGKEIRKPGSTIQAIVLKIKSINNLQFATKNWAIKAFNDQSTKKINKDKINYYRIFFFTASLNQNNSKNLIRWKNDTLSKVEASQLQDGSFPLTTINMQFGGKIMSTAISLLTIENLIDPSTLKE